MRIQRLSRPIRLLITLRLWRKLRVTESVGVLRLPASMGTKPKTRTFVNGWRFWRIILVGLRMRIISVRLRPTWKEVLAYCTCLALRLTGMPMLELILLMLRHVSGSVKPWKPTMGFRIWSKSTGIHVEFSAYDFRDGIPGVCSPVPAGPFGP